MIPLSPPAATSDLPLRPCKFAHLPEAPMLTLYSPCLSLRGKWWWVPRDTALVTPIYGSTYYLETDIVFPAPFSLSPLL